MLKCQLRSHLDSILPSVKRNVEQLQLQQKQKSQHDTHSKVQTFKKDNLEIWAILQDSNSYQGNYVH